MNAPLYGLVLAGGRSTRMRADKAALDYHGRSQLAAAMQLLEPFVARAFVSVRADQVHDPVRAGFAQIIDREPDRGPIAGIMAAQAEHENAAWLVLACDLPFLDAPTLAALVAARDPARDATAYPSAHDGLPEPLCAIYEPASRAKLAAYVAQNGQCPRTFLAQANAKFLAAPDARVLDNINTRAEYDATVQSLKPQGTAAIQLRVQYYALLREQAGRSEESLQTHARTARDLYLELARRYPFSLASEQLRVAVNEEFADWSRSLADGDCVVFIPPVAGG
jgi:molybdopterin-guanine dinucleotide biosynthesis protein A